MFFCCTSLFITSCIEFLHSFIFLVRYKLFTIFDLLTYGFYNRHSVSDSVYEANKQLGEKLILEEGKLCRRCANWERCDNIPRSLSCQANMSRDNCYRCEFHIIDSIVDFSVVDLRNCCFSVFGKETCRKKRLE